MKKYIGRDGDDERVWVDAMTRALGGILATGATVNAETIATIAAKTADCALAEYQKRTPPEDE